jgi:hypothetical protein
VIFIDFVSVASCFDSAVVKPSVSSNGNAIVNKSKLLAPTISVAGVLASVSSSSTSVAAPPAASAVSKENKLSIANRPAANSAARPNATAMAPATAAKGGFVRKTFVKPSSVGITVEKRAPATFGKPTPAASASSAPTSAVAKADAPIRNVKAPTFMSRDQKTANMVVAGRDKRDQVRNPPASSPLCIAPSFRASPFPIH